MPLRLKLNSGYSKHLALAEQQTEQTQTGAAQFDPQKTYHKQENEARTKILIPFVALWEQNKNKLPPLAQITDLYIKKFNNLVLRNRKLQADQQKPIDLQAIAQETINQGMSAKQKKVSKQPAPVQQAAQPAPATPTEQKPELKQQLVKKSALFNEKLDAIKEAFELSEEQVDVLKKLNVIFMRANATLEEAKKWSKNYIKGTIKSVINGAEFSDFDEVGKSNLMEILYSVFTTIYFPQEASLEDKKTTNNVEAVSEKAAEKSPKQSSGDVEKVKSNDGAETTVTASTEKNINDSDKETIKNIKEISPKITDEVINKIINIINSEFLEDQTAASLNEGASSSKAKQIVNIINNLQLTDLEKHKLYSTLTSFILEKTKGDKDKIVDAHSFHRIISQEGQKYYKANLDDMRARRGIKENLFSKFMNKEKTLNKKQVFRFDGDTFKKYNRG